MILDLIFISLGSIFGYLIFNKKKFKNLENKKKLLFKLKNDKKSKSFEMEKLKKEILNLKNKKSLYEKKIIGIKNLIKKVDKKETNFDHLKRIILKDENYS